MEVDPSDDNFYDDLASFMPQPGDYNLDDIDEILRCTDSQLDSSIDLDNLVTENVTDNFALGLQELQQLQYQQQLHNWGHQQAPGSDFCNFELTLQSSSPSYTSQRTSSISSMDDDNFKPCEFIKFLKSNNIKTEEITLDDIIDMPQRNTPSPTGSCTSSSGSSTSGIQSDASSNHLENASLNEHEIDNRLIKTENFLDQSYEHFSTFSGSNSFVAPGPPASVTSTIVESSTVTTLNTTVPMALPLLPISSAPAGTILQPLTQVQSIGMLQGTVIPIKTVPVTHATSVVNAKTIAPVKVGPKLAPKVTQPIKVATPTKSSGKLSSPPNSKPKTVYLSSGDFKALMQKMNSTGKNTKAINKAGGSAPVIITKNPNGKVITANKMINAEGNGFVKQNFAPKMIKTAAPAIVKQHNTKSVANTKTLANETATSMCTIPDLSVFKGIIDERILKKQQRMIKNRESASLSRKKKKEYVMSLESHINKLEKENYTLKGENTSLRSQLVALAQTCQCKNSNVGEFILNSLNANTKNGNGTDQHHHVKIAPKPAPGKNIRTRISAANMKKNVAVLFAMAFMVTLNMGGFKTCFNKNSIESAAEQSEEPTAVGRRLLWVETEKEFNEKLNRTASQVDVPPLHFLRRINRTDAANGASAQRNVTLDEPTLGAKCSGHSNYTENLRLASNLHKWIGGNDYLNLSKHGKFSKDLDNSLGFKLAPEFLKLNSIHLPLQGSGPPRKRKIYVDSGDYDTKHRKLDLLMDNAKPINGKHSLELFKPKLSDEYSRLFKGIKRRDDTFYVLSFNMDHILLSASSYNKSSRPKMSLMLPAGDPSMNGDVVLMQIDCEVINTTELSLKSEIIPEKLRPSKYKNFNFHPQPSPNPNDVANNETNPQRKLRRDAAETTVEKSREKPPIRTYLMSSKAQAAAAQKRNSSIIKVHTNEDRVLNKLKNSTLFTKMNENVNNESDTLVPIETIKIDLEN